MKIDDKYLYKKRKYDLKNYNYINKIKGTADSYKKYESAVVMPRKGNNGGVRSVDGCFLEESCYRGDWIKLGGNYDISSVNCIHETVIYLGFFIKHWGHFLVDSIGRAWIATKEEFKEYKYVYLLEENNKAIDGTNLEFLELLGIKKENLIFIDQPTRFDEVIIPSCSTDDSYGFTDGYKKIFEAVVENANIENINVSDRVYLSRSYLGKEIGEKNIEQIFYNNDYDIVHPEQLSLREQIAIFRKAKEIVCINGSLPFGSAYSDLNLKLIILNKTSIIHDNMIRVSEMTGINPIYIDVYNEPLKNYPKYLGVGPFWLVCSDMLKQYFEDNGLIWDDRFPKDEYKITRYIRYYIILFIDKLKMFLIKNLIKVRDKFRNLKKQLIGK